MAKYRYVYIKMSLAYKTQEMHRIILNRNDGSDNFQIEATRLSKSDPFQGSIVPNFFSGMARTIGRTLW